MHRRPLPIQTLFRAVLRSLEPWLRSLSSRFRARPARLHARPPWLRALPSAARSWFGRLSLESVFRDAGRLARRPSRLTLGVAAGTVVATAAVLAAVSGGSASPAAAVADQDQDQVRVPAPSVSAGHGAPDGAASASARNAQPAGHASPAGTSRPAARARASASPSRGSRATTRHLARPAAPAKPYLIYDSLIPGAIPASQGTVATYADGPGAVPASEVAGRKSVLWISVTGGDYNASVIDVEPGNASPAGAANWAWHRLSANPHAIARIYTFINEWPAAKAAVASFPAQMRSRIHWWIANPTGSPHLLPGSDATQWYWGSTYDISTATPGF